MKKNIAIAFLCTAFLLPFRAEAKDTMFNLFLVGAYHNNTFETTTVATGITAETEDDAALGLGLGLTAEFRMGSSSSFELGVAYIQRKSETTGTLLGVPVTIESEIDVIELPMIMHFYLSQAVSFGIGGYIGIASNAANTAETEFGATAALRFILGQSLFIGGRYNLGLTDILEATSTTATQTVKSNGFYVLAGLRF